MIKFEQERYTLGIGCNILPAICGVDCLVEGPMSLPQVRWHDNRIIEVGE